jgi:hypothetical protein
LFLFPLLPCFKVRTMMKETSMRLVKRASVCLIIAVGVAAFSSPVRGDLVNGFDSSNPVGITSVLDDVATGELMAGMLVKVTFAGGSSETAVWTSFGGGAGGATGTSVPGWSLSQSGNTFFGSWTFDNSTGLSVTELSISALQGGISFDVPLNGIIDILPFAETPNSLLGLAFDAGSSDDSLTGTATYSRPIGVASNGFAPSGDLWGKLTLAFGGAGMASGTDLEFAADSDLMSEAIPEPSSMVAMAAVGLAVGAGALIRKRKNKNSVTTV